MSEYQYYEFLAIDHPLDADEQAQMRSLSTRARITATSFVNEYHWGDFRGDPTRLMERYYDAHLYVANWGTHRVMLRLPGNLLDPDVVEDYCVGEQFSARITNGFIVLDLTSEDDAGESSTTTPRPYCRQSSVYAPNSPPATCGRSTSAGWPPTADGSETRTPSTATPTTISSHPCRPAWPRSPRRSGRWPTSFASTRTYSPSRPRQVHRSRTSPTIPAN